MKDLESILNIIANGMSKKTAIILMLTIASILLSFSYIKTLAEELPVLVLLSLLAGFYIALYALAFDIICWLFSQLNTLLKFLRNISITTFMKLKSSLQNNKNRKLIQNSFIEKIGDNEVKYLSLFFGKPKKYIENQHGLIPKEAIAYFEDLCRSNLMRQETTTDGASYEFYLDTRFAQTLRKTFYSSEQINYSLTLSLKEIQANIVTTGGGLANGGIRT